MIRIGTKLGFAALLLGLGCSNSSSNPSAKSGASGTKLAPLVTPDVYLQAQAFQVAAGQFGNTAPITMWGYAQCTAGFASCGTPTVPGPELTAYEGTQLNLHVRNALAGPYVEPTSVVINGQLTAMAPVWIDPATRNVSSTGARAPGDYTSRVRSFTTETPADGATETVYSWPSVKAGTYLYESGTHPAVQVQMGLYGALRVLPATTGQAYDDPSSHYDNEATLVFSEIDPVLHNAIAAGQYGPNPNAPNDPPPGWLTSTSSYRPQYFLINGQPWSPTTAPIAGGPAGSKLLLRVLNAGLETKVPLIQQLYFTMIAEDGNFLAITNSAGAVVPAPRDQYTLFLTAGKTFDALVTGTTAGNVALYDRRLNLSNAGTSPGGQLAYVAFTAAPVALKTGSGPAVAQETR